MEDDRLEGYRAAVSSLQARIEELEEAICEFVDAYPGGQSGRLGNGQARRSLDRFKILLGEEDRHSGS